MVLSIKTSLSLNHLKMGGKKVSAKVDPRAVSRGQAESDDLETEATESEVEIYRLKWRVPTKERRSCL